MSFYKISVLLSHFYLLSIFSGIALANAALTIPPQQKPDLAWEISTFAASHREPTRFIDYADGLDSNPGTRERPWKHHPWDPNATGNAATAEGISTYIFKRGSIYRGQLIARESGTATSPIHLTVDPEWGTGEAVLTGADILQPPEWRHCATDEAQRLPPSSRKTAYCATAAPVAEAHRLWITEGEIRPIPLARLPHWDDSGYPDPRAQWLALEHAELEMVIDLDSTRGLRVGDRLWVTGSDPVPMLQIHGMDDHSITSIIRDWPRRGLPVGTQLTNGTATVTVTGTSGVDTLVRRIHHAALTHPGIGDLTGAVLRIERPSTQQLTTGRVLGNDPAAGYLRAHMRLAATRGVRQHDRFYLEGLPQFLDRPGEFAMVDIGGDLAQYYLRLPGDRDPNQVALEIPRRLSILEIEDQEHIEVSGLSFRFVKLPGAGIRQAYHAALHTAAIQLRGNVSNIRISHSRFQHLENGIVGYPARDRAGQILDRILITDNDFSHIDGSAIAIGSGQDRASHKGKGRLIETRILRNRIRHSGLLSSTHGGQGSYGHGIDIDGVELAEVAYNHVHHSGGSGISVYMGSMYEKSGMSLPLLRGLIHHNKVSNSLLGLQDFGGIESWNGGPVYIYNNISINPVGYRHGRSLRGEQESTFKKGSYGVGIYLDSQYKGYIFNNIAWGYENNIDVDSGIYNAAAFNEAMGFMNSVFNNSFLGFAVGIQKGSAPQHNRGSYLGNLLLDMGHAHILQWPTDNIEHASLAFAKNVFHGNPHFFGKLGRRESSLATLDDWRSHLNDKGALLSDSGVLAFDPVIRDQDQRDFRLGARSPAIDQGVRFFVPWALSRVAGEWHFYRSSTPNRVRDEGLNMDRAWLRSRMFQDIPRMDLECQNTDSADYRDGPLEDWIPGALSFDGETRFCRISHDRINAGFDWRDARSGESGRVPEGTRDSLDIDGDSFIIEAYLAAEPATGRRGILSKFDARGYLLELDDDGRLSLGISDGTASFRATSDRRLDSSDWHHILVEVDRHDRYSVRFYLDGVLDADVAMDRAMAVADLSNSGDFLVGKSPAGLFSGRLDFLRISKGTLADARTNITELHDWQFNGPHLRDFTGRSPTGAARDAGAVEYAE